ncbi:hypothetical protein L6164_036761 [Bauhinia variegata]|uniref:Uncharacterized protein n=1 Tax=Bauhinia variegata TaxID=167791 RepID=A0ACB9KI25_BAUVA|nr:hypothetical protein L6164_036761 [Bauhinia variegata]
MGQDKSMKKIVFILLSALSILGKCHAGNSQGAYEAMFTFGDSLSDTGNYVGFHDPSDIEVLNKLPYGKTFFGKPTGRFCDGRIILDFIAEAYGLPFVPPYADVIHGKVQNIRQGVNFAVAGATALDANFILSKRNQKPIKTMESLDVQVGWFKKLKPSLCSNEQDCARLFKKSLFFVGEIGGNDLGLLGFNFSTAGETIPLIVEAITNATITLIEEGAVHLVVPGNPPMGCTAGFIKSGLSKDQYDSRGCFKRLNTLVELENKEIKQAVSELKKKYPHVTITFFDYYGAANQFYDAPQKYGFSEMLKPCFVAKACNDTAKTYTCGFLCENPATYTNWDGAHYTEAAYKIIAQSVIDGHFSHPPLKHPLKKIA